MDTFIAFSKDERRTYCNEAQALLGLPAASIEKDFWVCWTLRELFDLPEIRSHLTFKGGTSLSKAWKLINRFSEDIDIVIDREVLGFGGDASPDQASSRKQLTKWLSALKDACRNLVQGQILTTCVSASSRTLETPEIGPWRLIPTPKTDNVCRLLIQESSPAATFGQWSRSSSAPARTPSPPRLFRSSHTYLLRFLTSSPQAPLRFLLSHRGGPFGRRLCSCTRRPTARLTSPGRLVFRATTTTYGV